MSDVQELAARGREIERLETEVERLREVLVFADGAALTGLGMPLSRLYAEDCEWAQETLRGAGCHSRDAKPIDFDAADEMQPCIGGDYCGRVTNGWFEAGSHGPGYYCGWCECIPA